MPFKDPIKRKEYDKLWRTKHPNKVTHKSHKQNIKRFGMTPEDFAFLVSNQNNKCKLCEKPFNYGRRPSIDHCHTSGVVRGLLCIKCNGALGLVDDNIQLLSKMIDYLKAEPSSTKFRII